MALKKEEDEEEVEEEEGGGLRKAREWGRPSLGVFSPRRQSKPCLPRRGLRKLMGRMQGSSLETEIPATSNLHLKMHSKGTGLLVSALISNQWVGAPMSHVEGAQAPQPCNACPPGKGPGRMTIQGQSTRWLRQGCWRLGGLVRTLEMGPERRSRLSREPLQCPVGRGRFQGMGSPASEQ